MHCFCGEPSCGYCQAARQPHSSNYHLNLYDVYVPNDPAVGLTTIFEENEEEFSGNVEREVDENDVDDDEDASDANGSEELDAITRNELTDLQISEEEKKRLRNTEAARRCREKIKRKAEELEMELSHLSARNDLMNQHRIRLLSQVEEQMRMLELMRARNPAIEAEIRHEAKHIVDSYANQVEIKRRAIQEYFDKNCTKFY